MGTVIVPSLVLEGEWIPPSRGRGRSEYNLTRVLLAKSDVLFPDYFLVEFDLLLGQDLEDQVQVDLALVAKDCKSWCLLYVMPTESADLPELEHRVEATQSPRYSIREAREIKRNLDDLTLEQLSEMVTCEDPKLIVVTDDPHHGWSEKLSHLNLTIMVVEVFSNEQKCAMRVNGEYPYAGNETCIAWATPNPFLLNTLQLDRSLPGEINESGQMTLNYRGHASNWNIVNINGAVLITTSDLHCLPQASRYEITQKTDGTLLIQPLEE